MKKSGNVPLPEQMFPASPFTPGLHPIASSNSPTATGRISNIIAGAPVVVKIEKHRHAGCSPELG